jgi:hypothetical protein
MEEAETFKVIRLHFGERKEPLASLTGLTRDAARLKCIQLIQRECQVPNPPRYTYAYIEE